MRIFIAVLVLIFSLQSWVMASYGVIQYCIYQGQWSLVFKHKINFKNNTQWCKIVYKSENPALYDELFKKALAHSGKHWISTNTL